jgi:hypothetical protein
LKLLLGPFVLLAVAWAAAAIWFDGPAARPLAGALAAGFALASLALYVAVQPTGRALLCVAGAFAFVCVWWLRIPPSNDRDWLPDVARPAEAHFDGSRVTIRNVRNFTYRSETDYDERWETRRYDLDRLTGVDMFFSFCGHTLMSQIMIIGYF